MLYEMKLPPEEIRLLQQYSIAHLPSPLKEQAQAIITTHGQNAAEPEKQLAVWAAANQVAAKTLEQIPDIGKRCTLALEALSYVWGGDEGEELAKTPFCGSFEASKENHSRHLAPASEEFVAARNALNNAIREQLLMLLPAIKEEYGTLNSSAWTTIKKRMPFWN